MKVVGAIDGISFVYFDDRDVVRHKLVQQIVKAYEAFSNGNGGASAMTRRSRSSRSVADRMRRRPSASAARRRASS